VKCQGTCPETCPEICRETSRETCHEISLETCHETCPETDQCPAKYCAERTFRDETNPATSGGTNPQCGTVPDPAETFPGATNPVTFPCGTGHIETADHRGTFRPTETIHKGTFHHIGTVPVPVPATIPSGTDPGS